MLLIRNARWDLHLKLGLLAVILIPVMAYSGIAAELYSQRFYIQRRTEGLQFFILPLFYIFGFTVFAVTAVILARRGDFAAHKRLILMATTIIVGAAYARWWGESLNRLFGDAFWGMILNSFAGTNLILAGAVTYDFYSRGRPHRVYMIGVPIILAGQLLCSWIYHADWWPPLSRQLIEVRLPLST
jgi:hypothetical protein